MPKRGKDCDFEILAKKLRKLEKKVKRSRRAGFPLSSSSSSSSSESSEHRSSRESSPEADENLNCQGTTSINSPSASVSMLNTQPVENNDDLVDTTNVTQPEGQTVPIESVEMNAEILDILGVDPSVTVEYGPEINKDVATRLSHVATVGLKQEVRKELIEKHLIPANCTSIAAPQLNAEIKAALSESVLKRDKAIETRQKQIAAGITSLGKIISDQLICKEKNNNLIKDLMDVSRIFCDIQHSESDARRNFALYSVKKDLKDQLSTTKIDKYLFGNNLNETLKAAKAVSKSSSDLKLDPPKKPKHPTPSTSSQKNLNWKARTPARRQPPVAPPRHPMPAPSSALPPGPRGTSSQPYAQRPKQTRRR